jgi:hypothetical protein
MNDRPISETTIGKWQAWAEKRYGDDRELVEVGAHAAITALRSGRLPDDAARAGKAAAENKIAERRRTASAPPRTAGAGTRPPPFTPPNLSPHSGTIVGYARQVRVQPQMVGGHILLDFTIESPGSPSIHVQMRGLILDGVISEGDQVEVQSKGIRGGFLQTDQAYNRTKNYVVRMRTGASGVAGTMQAQWGRQWKRPLIFFGAFAAIVVIFIVAAWIAVAVGFLTNTDNEPPHPPAWFCEQANNSGGTPPAGC